MSLLSFRHHAADGEESQLHGAGEGVAVVERRHGTTAQGPVLTVRAARQ